MAEDLKELKRRSHNTAIPIEEKESIRWIASLKDSTHHPGLKNVKVATVCDREADIYDLFEVAFTNQSLFLVRGNQNRTVNKKSTYSEKGGERLWDLMNRMSCQGEIQVNIPARNDKPQRTTVLEVKFSNFVMNASKNNARQTQTQTSLFPNFKVYIYRQGG